MIYNLYKPRGISSQRYLRYFGRKFGVPKLGFLGTLDPLAEGILPVFTGPMTRLIPFLGKPVKTYQFSIRWGYTSHSLDGEGFLQPAEAGSLLTEAVLQEARSYFLDLNHQQIPAFSAKKFQGKRLYHAARKGQAIAPEALEKTVRLHNLEFFPTQGAEFLTGRMTVSDGFYVRAFVRDLAEYCHKAGYLDFLLREKVGEVFKARNALTLNDLEQSQTIFDLPTMPLSQLFPDWLLLELKDESIASRIRHGQKVLCDISHFLSPSAQLSYFCQPNGKKTQNTLAAAKNTTYTAAVDPIVWGGVLQQNRPLAFGNFSAEESPNCFCFTPKIVF